MTRHYTVALLVLAATGCTANLFHTEVKGETTLQGNPVEGVLNTFPTIGNFTSLDFNENQEFKNQQIGKDQVSSVKVDSVKLKILSPIDQDFAFLDSLQFFAKSADEETLIAEKNGISELGLVAPNPVLLLDVKDVELKKHIAAPTMSIIVRGRGRNPPKDTRLEATVGLRVDLKVF
jgi:hypothetical protein